MGVNDFGDHYVYHSGDSVFHLENDQFHLLFDFGAQVGDEWLISIDTASFDPLCGDSSFVKVIGTGIESLNGTNYRYLDLETIPGSPKYLFGRFSECFEDNALTYNPTSGDYEHYLTQLQLGVYDLEGFIFQVNPNPTAGEILFS